MSARSDHLTNELMQSLSAGFSQQLLPALDTDCSDLSPITSEQEDHLPPEHTVTNAYNQYEQATFSSKYQYFKVQQCFVMLQVLCKRFASSIWNGPKKEKDMPPRPIKCLSAIDLLPMKLRLIVPSHYRVLLLVVYVIVWVYVWAMVMTPYFTTPTQGEGSPIMSITCGQVADFWKGKNAACGINSRFCPSLDSKLDVIFRCPALCDRGSWLYSLRAIGDQVVKYRGFYVGGGEYSDPENPDTLSYPYRADSFPCGAAVHAGIVSPIFGGCAKISYQSGAQTSFASALGHHGVSDSIGFDSFFPKSFIFKRVPRIFGPCKDPRVVIMIFNVFMGAPMAFFASSIACYWIMALVGFWTISLATDPPVLVDPQDPETLYDLVSISLERFLPTCFILYVLWTVSVKRTFHLKDEKPSTSSETETETETEIETETETEIEIEIETGASNEIDTIDENCLRVYRYQSPCYSPVFRVVFWYLFFWLGVLNNMTFDRLPVDRLTLNDLHSMPGALLVISILGGITLVCVATQAYYLWLLGRLWNLLKVYAVVSGLLVMLALLPGLTLRIHHYIFALLLIPGCSTKGWTAYVFQGLLLGLYLSGVARWGYASIVETNFSLLRGEPIGHILAPVVENYDSGVLYWNRQDGGSYDTKIEDVDRYTEVSLLINDVERFRGADVGNINITRIIETNERLRDLVHMSLEERSENKDIALYLRLARYSNREGKCGDYTQTSILKYPSLRWMPAPPGIT